MSKIFIKLENGLIIFACVGLAFFMVLQVALRYVFQVPLYGTEEISTLLGLWIYFLGIIHVTRTRQHISSGVFQLFIKSESLLKALEIFKVALCAFGSAVFSYFAILYWIQSYESGRSSTYLSWPRTIWVTSMLVGFLLATVFFLMHLWLVSTGKEKAMTHQEEVEHKAPR